MTEEIWRPIVGYEGLYEVSSYGRVRSLDRYDSKNCFWKGRILKLNDNGRGYLRAHLCLNNKIKNFLVHRLVAQAFIPNPDNLPEVNHINEDKTNNRVDNLEFCNHKYNVNYGTRTDRMRDTKIKNGYWSGLSKEEYNKKWYQENKEKRREYNQENKEKRREYWEKWHQEHKKEYNERKREYVKNYYLENRDKINERRRENRRKKKVGL